MRRLAALVGLLLSFALPAGSAKAAILVTIDKSQQQMSVAVDGEVRYTWAVSTGRAGYGTPSGTYRPQQLARKWYSHKYHHAPMPHAIFFDGGFAIHGSHETSRLGGPASHGCVRLAPANAATLFALVQSRELGETQIVVTGSSASAQGHAHGHAHGHSHAHAHAHLHAHTHSAGGQRGWDGWPRSGGWTWSSFGG